MNTAFLSAFIEGLNVYLKRNWCISSDLRNARFKRFPENTPLDAPRPYSTKNLTLWKTPNLRALVTEKNVFSVRPLPTLSPPTLSHWSPLHPPPPITFKAAPRLLITHTRGKNISVLITIFILLIKILLIQLTVNVVVVLKTRVKKTGRRLFSSSINN